jgi:hypothetical protein
LLISFLVTEVEVLVWACISTKTNLRWAEKIRTKWTGNQSF